VKPPPGGSVVRDAVHPGGGWTGAGTEVGVADGIRLVLVGAEVVVVVGSGRRWCAAAGTAERAAHAVPITVRAAATTAATLRRATGSPNLVAQAGASRSRKTMPVLGFG
jgi:hypothetical protein